MSSSTRVAVLGAGEIGSGWAALFASGGAEVRVHDPDPAAGERIEAALRAAGASAARFRSASEPASRSSARISFHQSARQAVEGAAWVQESIPETLEAKRALFSEVAPGVGNECIVASSTSTLTLSALAQDLPYASRLVIAHPLHPVFVVPVVELGAGSATAPETVDRAAAFLRSFGRQPVVVRGDLPGMVSNRLTAALLREAIVLVERGVISAVELDMLVSRGIATGWAAAGVFGTEAVGAGRGSGAAERASVLLARMVKESAGESLTEPEIHTLSDALRKRAADAPDPERWAELIRRILRASAAP